MMKNTQRRRDVNVSACFYTLNCKIQHYIWGFLYTLVYLFSFSPNLPSGCVSPVYVGPGGFYKSDCTVTWTGTWCQPCLAQATPVRLLCWVVMCFLFLLKAPAATARRDSDRPRDSVFQSFVFNPSIPVFFGFESCECVWSVVACRKRKNSSLFCVLR